MSARKAKTKLLVTQCALGDLAEIERYTVAQWGRKTAGKYFADIEAALERIQANTDLLRPEEGLHPDLRFYRVNKHLLVCDMQSKAILMLTVTHASRGIPSRLAEFQPTLPAEVELLRKKIK